MLVLLLLQVALMLRAPSLLLSASLWKLLPSTVATFPQAMASAEATTCATHFIASWIELATPFDGRWVPTFSKTTHHAPVMLTIIWTWHGVYLYRSKRERLRRFPW